MGWAFPSLPLYHNGGNSLVYHLLLSFHLCPSACIIVTKNISQDEHGWTLINPDEVFFDRLDDRAYQPVTSHPFGHGITLCCRQALSVSFIAALSQWGKQYNWASVFVITSVSICVHHCYKLLFSCYNETFYRMNADNCGMAAKHSAFVTLCWAEKYKETHQGERER